MDLSWLIGILIIAVVFGLALKLLHKLITAIIITTIIILIGTVATGYFIYQDFQDLTTEFPTSINLFLLKDSNERLVNGMAISIDELKNANLKGINTLSPSELIEYEGFIEEKKFERIQNDGDYYKILVYSTEFFESTLPDTITPFQEMGMTKDEALSYIEDNDGLEKFLNDIAEKQINPNLGIDKNMVMKALMQELSKIGIKNEESFDSILIMACFKEIFTDFSGGNVLIQFVQQYKKKNLIIYPKTIAFKMISFIPIGLVDSAIEKAKKTIDEKNPLTK